MKCNKLLPVGLIAIFCYLIASQPTIAGIISDASGTIDLELKPFWDTMPGTNEPTSSQIVSIPIGLDDVSASIDGTGYYSAQGLSSVDYQYTSLGKSKSRFDFSNHSEAADSAEGGGGHASVELDITFAAPVYFRFEADAESYSINYEVSFNDVSAYASRDPYFGGVYGTFPIHYYYEDGVPVFAYGWYTYIHEGVLPAGTYHLTTEALGGVHGRYLVGLASTGTASLYVQLLGDVNDNGRVGEEDLHLVLSHWGKTANKQGKLLGDANGDGIVDQDDLDLVMLGMNGGVETTPLAVNIPEPASAVLFLAVSLILHRR